MVNDIRIYIAIGVFMIVSVSLMIYNLVIIYYSKTSDAQSTKRNDKWRNILYKQSGIAAGKKHTTPKHRKYLLKKLSNPENLVAYSNALQYIKSEFSEEYSGYINKIYPVFRQLADRYSKKSSIEKACYADFISSFPQVARGGMQGHLVDIIISYIDDFNIHCRVNVIRAICSMGSIQGVENALRIINDKSLFVHTQLLTNELSNFSGDKEDLAHYLWSKCLQWNDNLVVSVIQFITRFSGKYNQRFLTVLQDSSVSIEVRAAIIRYFGKNVYKPAHPALIELINGHANIKLAAEAASALGGYPALETITTIKTALDDTHWNMRYNASQSLVKLGDENALTEILEDEKDYKRKLVVYMLQREALLQNAELEGEAVAV